MSKNFRISLSEQMKNEEFRREYDDLEKQFNIITSIVEMRNKNHVTQKELSKLTGIAQGDISKIENGNANPSIKTLEKIASALGYTLKLKFEPIGNSPVK